MHLSDYLGSQERGRAKQLAEAMGVSKSYLSQMATGKVAVSPARCIEIEIATNKLVTRADMRPDDWQKIWPEFVPVNL